MASDSVLLSRMIFSLAAGSLVFLWRFLLTGARKQILFPGGDSVVHFYYLRMLEHTGRLMIKEDKRFVVDPATYRPQLFYKLVARVMGLESALKRHHLVNPSLDALFSIFLFNVSFEMFRIGWDREKAIILAAVTLALYMTSPILVFFKERAANFGERLFSYIIGMSALIFTLLYLEHHLTIYLILTVLLTLIVVFSSQFTLQALILLQFFFSILSGNFIPILTIFVSLALTFLIDRKWLMDYYRAKKFHFTYYYKALKSGHYSLDSVYRYFWIHILVFGLPYMLLFFSWNELSGLFQIAVYRYMIYYILSSFIICLLVYLPVFRPIGEAVRYVEYSLPFVLILLVTQGGLNGHILPLAILLGFNILSYLHYVLKINMENDDDEDLRDIIRFLKPYKDKRILPVPFKLSYFLATFLENELIASLVPRGKIDTISAHYNYAIGDFDRIAADYPFDWIVYRKKKGDDYDFSSMKTVYQNGKYVIWEK